MTQKLFGKSGPGRRYGPSLLNPRGESTTGQQQLAEDYACQEMKSEKLIMVKPFFAAFIHNEKDAFFGKFIFGVLVVRKCPQLFFGKNLEQFISMHF